MVSSSDCQYDAYVHRNSPGLNESQHQPTQYRSCEYFTLTKIGRMGIIYELKKKRFRVVGSGVQGRGVPQHDHRDPGGARLRTREGSRFPSAPPPTPRAASGISPTHPPPVLFSSQITSCRYYDGSVMDADPDRDPHYFGGYGSGSASRAC